MGAGAGAGAGERALAGVPSTLPAVFESEPLGPVSGALSLAAGLLAAAGAGAVLVLALLDLVEPVRLAVVLRPLVLAPLPILAFA